MVGEAVAVGRNREELGKGAGAEAGQGKGGEAGRGRCKEPGLEVSRRTEVGREERAGERGQNVKKRASSRQI